MVANRRTGGRIPTRNKPVSAPGVGKNSKRHDLERRATPYLQGSDLQQGDVQALEQGQRIQPIKRTQPPAMPQRGGAGQGAPQSATTGASPMPTDPISFLAQRLGGTYQPKPGLSGPSRHDYRSWLPLMSRLAKTPGASGTLVSAYITRLNNMLTAPTVHTDTFIDQQDEDAALERFLGGE